MAEPQKFIDRMLEIENLTDNLEDADANYLLNWGVERMRTIVEPEADPEAAGQRANQLHAFIRTLNQISANLQNVGQEDLDRLTEFARLAFGIELDLAPEELANTIAELKGMSQRQAIERLTQRLSPGNPAPAKPV